MGGLGLFGFARGTAAPFYIPILVHSFGEAMVLKALLKLAVVIVVILLLLAAAGSYLRKHHGSIAPSTTVATSSVQANVTTTVIEALINAFGPCSDNNTVSGFSCGYMAQQAAAWQPFQNNSVGWAVNMQAVGYDGVLTVNLQDAEAELSMLNSTGASCVRIDMGYDAWLLNYTSAQDNMTAIVNQIRKDGKCLIIADASAEYYRHHQLPWTQFKAAWVQRVTTLAKLYHPDYYIVVKEPGWYYPMIQNYRLNPQVFAASQWNNLTVQLADAVHNVSPNTKIGVAVPGESLQYQNIENYLANVTRMPQVSFIGFDVYGSGDLGYSLAFLDNYGSNGKQVWITETWDNVNGPVDTPQQKVLDSYYMVFAYFLAQHMNATVVIPFFTDSFSSYTEPANYSNHTPVYYVFKQLVARYGKQIT